MESSTDSSHAERGRSVSIRCQNAPNARAAIECAIADLEAQRAGVNLAVYWRRLAGMSGEGAQSVGVQALVGGETHGAVFDSAKRFRQAGYGAFKLKLAVSRTTPGISADLRRVAALREAVGPDARIRLDANEAWIREEARVALQALAEWGIDYVEQPIARDDLEGLALLDRDSPIRIAADESLLGQGLDKCIDARAASIFVVKPAAIGGFRASIGLERRASALGIRVVWSSLIDGVVSRQAALHLAAALEAAGEVHGLGTGALMATDLAKAPPVRSGKIELSKSPGLGLDNAPSARADFEGEADFWSGPADFLEDA